MKQITQEALLQSLNRQTMCWFCILLLWQVQITVVHLCIGSSSIIFEVWREECETKAGVTVSKLPFTGLWMLTRWPQLFWNGFHWAELDHRKEHEIRFAIEALTKKSEARKKKVPTPSDCERQCYLNCSNGFQSLCANLNPDFPPWLIVLELGLHLALTALHSCSFCFGWIICPRPPTEQWAPAHVAQHSRGSCQKQSYRNHHLKWSWF